MSCSPRLQSEHCMAFCDSLHTTRNTLVSGSKGKYSAYMHKHCWCEAVGVWRVYIVEPHADSVEVLERKLHAWRTPLGSLHAWLEKDRCFLIHMESDPMRQQRERESILVYRPLYPNKLNQLEELQWSGVLHEPMYSCLYMAILMPMHSMHNNIMYMQTHSKLAV